MKKINSKRINLYGQFYCPGCCKYLDSENFHKNKTNKYGIESRCKPCRAAIVKKYNKRVSSYYSKKHKELRKCDLNFRLKINIRDRLYKALKFQKNFKSFNLIGCSLDQLKKHLESQFQPGMTWDNYGKWHIDHKFPISMVELSNKDELLKVCNYQNLQPLWAKDNYRKNNRINDIIKKDFESIVL